MALSFAFNNSLGWILERGEGKICLNKNVDLRMSQSFYHSGVLLPWYFDL